MPESMDTLLRDAAPHPRRTPDFDDVWERAQRQRRRQRLALTVAGATAVILAVFAAALALPDRGVNLEFADDGPTPERGASERPPVPEGWREMTVGSSVFAAPADWPVYGDDGADEYRDRHCELGQIGPAVFVAHSLPDEYRACRLMKLGDAAGVQVATVDVATSMDMYSVWLDEPSTTTTVETDTGSQTVTEWQDDERAAGGWRLRRFDDLGVFVLSRAYDQAAVIDRLLRTFRPADGNHLPVDGVRLASDEYDVIAAAATRDASLKGHVVRDSNGLAAVWQMANVSGEPPALPPRTVGVFVIARETQSTCRSVDDVVGVEIHRGMAVVQLDADGAFVQPCPGPEGAHAWTAFVVAIPDRYDHIALTGADARVGAADAVTSPGWRTHHDASAGLSLTYPAIWHVAARSLTPHLDDPKELVTLTSFPLPERGDSGVCAQVPWAISALEAGETLISVQERQGGGQEFSPRPEVIDAFTHGPDELEVAQCFPDKPDLHPYRLDMQDQGRPIYILVVFGDEPTEAMLDTAFEVLNTLTLTPAG